MASNHAEPGLLERTSAASELGDQWRRLTRVATAMAFVTSPAVQGPFEADGAAIEDSKDADRLSANSFFQSGVQELPSGGAVLVLSPPPGR